MAPTAKPPTTPAATAPPFPANAGAGAETDRASTETAAIATIAFIHRSIGCRDGKSLRLKNSLALYLRSELFASFDLFQLDAHDRQPGDIEGVAEHLPG